MFKKIIIVSILGFVTFISCNTFIIKAFRCTYLNGHITATVDDAKYFSNNTITTSTYQPWQKHAYYNKFSISDTTTAYLKKYNTISYLIAKDGKLLFETYFDGKDTLYPSNSFSMAKSITALLLGCALKDGYIKSLNQKIIKFLPEFKNDLNAQKVTVQNLATMSSGYD